jgi:hypothetical protein
MMPIIFAADAQQPIMIPKNWNLISCFNIPINIYQKWASNLYMYRFNFQHIGAIHSLFVHTAKWSDDTWKPHIAWI